MAGSPKDLLARSGVRTGHEYQTVTLPIIRHRDDWDRLVLVPLKDGSGFLLQNTYRVQFDWDRDGRGLKYFFQVPVGFHTDLASIPPLFKPLFGTWGKHTAAAIVHDCFYSYRAGTREMADDLFEALMVADGVDRDDARTMAFAVRLGGQAAWESEDVRPAVEVLRLDGYWTN